VACVEGAQRAVAETAAEQQARGAAADSTPRAPKDTVDSLEAA
jgi:hypothetical protein